MIEREFIIRNKVGLHARPASLFVQTAKKFESKITIRKEENEVNAKSIIGVLSLGAEKGDRVVIKIEGEDEREALKEIEELFNTNFGEDNEDN